jgi:hypothetical protein
MDLETRTRLLEKTCRLLTNSPIAEWTHVQKGDAHTLTYRHDEEEMEFVLKYMPKRTQTTIDGVLGERHIEVHNIPVTVTAYTLRLQVYSTTPAARPFLLFEEQEETYENRETPDAAQREPQLMHCTRDLLEKLAEAQPEKRVLFRELRKRISEYLARRRQR